ncbi:hypothetical protein AYK26_05270 [Euryarchaeota archaeon SM23-78]|nr:MAG: hypothetical protein AYK26_05270 [Euryarchaeota archaeon SM23-78]MBW3001472.1 histidine phosphatase family protein [Candidatus Woesearchaeota archaeon]
MIIYLIRHGETILNKKGVTQGHQDSPLTSKGMESAEKHRSLLSKKNIEIIYSSNLGRCVQTAKIINKFVKKDLVKTGELRERDFGVFNGRPNKEIVKELDLSNSNEVAPNGESFNQMKSRVLKFIKSLENKNYKKVLVVSHEGPVRAILSEYYMINFNSKKCDSPKEAIYEIEVKDGKIKGLKCINH